MTYNKYLTDGISDGTIEMFEVAGLRYCKVRRPLPGEEVIGYENLSGFLVEPTITEKAERDAN